MCYFIVEAETGRYNLDGYPCRNLENGLRMARQLNNRQVVEVYHADGRVREYWSEIGVEVGKWAAKGGAA